MRIKLLTSALLLGYNEALREGTVVESDNGPNVAEYNALITVGYAKETDEEVTAGEPAEVAPDVDSDLLAILRGTVDEITEQLGALTAEELDRLSVLEAALKDRKGVQDAIVAALASE